MDGAGTAHRCPGSDATIVTLTDSLTEDQLTKNLYAAWQDLAKKVLELEELTGLEFTSEQEVHGWKLTVDNVEVPDAMTPTIYSGRSVGDAYALVLTLIRFETARQSSDAGR